MSGRHRRTHTGVTRGALVGTLPVLGAAGAATGLMLSAGAAAPQAVPTAQASGLSDAGPAPAPPIRKDLPGGGAQAAAAAAEASAAARQQTDRDRAQEQQSLNQIVEQIRADARAREAAAVRDGRSELTSFREQQARAEQRAMAVQQQRDQQYQDDRSGQGECEVEVSHPGSAAHADDIVDRDCGITVERGSGSWVGGQLADLLDD